MTRTTPTLAAASVWLLTAVPAEAADALREIYEAILGRGLDKRNFRKKILSLGLLKSTGKKRAEGAHRPAELYRFRRRELSYIDVL